MKAIKNRSIENQWLSSIKKILPMINILHLKDSLDNVDKFYKLVQHLLKHKGADRTMQILKEYRLALQQFVLRQPLTRIPFQKIDKDGFPKAIRFLKPDRTDRKQVMYSLSVLRLIEEFRCKPKYLVDTITADSSAKRETLDEITAYIRGKPRILKVLPRELLAPRPILSNKAGPSGPASITCLQDLKALRQPGNEKLYETIRQFIKDKLDYIDVDKYKDPNGEFLHSKLVLLSDKACKTRVIAIADWWSNVCLSGIHDTFMKGLRRLSSDVTYFQDRIPSLVMNLGSNLYSSDMTAFTDRFPLELEVEVVKAAYGDTIGETWKTIISHREFYHENGGVRYKVGNPMGLLSSWAVSTFTHHVVKAWCAHKCGIRNFRNYKYLILGDDTLDSREDVYTMYKQTIENLGVSISTSKCTQSKDGYAEFAKRLFSPEGEVTGLPVHLLNGLKSHPEQVLELVRICRSRGYEDSVLGPALEILLSKRFISESKMVADILRLPEFMTGAPPLLEGNTSTWISPLIDKGKPYQEAVLALARESLFWKRIQSLQISEGPKHISPVEIENHHPLVFSLYKQVEAYLPEGAYNPETGEYEDEYFIYNSWMKGEYRSLCNLPDVNTYKYYNRGHKDTKCKFDVAKLVLQIANGDCNIPLMPKVKRTDDELYDMALASITPRRDLIG